MEIEVIELIAVVGWLMYKNSGMADKLPPEERDEPAAGPEGAEEMPVFVPVGAQQA